MYTKRFISSYISNGVIKKGVGVTQRGTKYVTLLIVSDATNDTGTHVTSFNPKDVARCQDSDGNWLADEVINSLPEEKIENFEKIQVDFDGIYNRVENGKVVIDKKTNRPAEYTSTKVAVMWSIHWDYLYVNGQPVLTPSATGVYEFKPFPVPDPQTGRPKRFYDQGWSPEERLASLIEAGFYIKATTTSSATSTSTTVPPATKTPEQIAAEAQLAAAQTAAQAAAQQPNPNAA